MHVVSHPDYGEELLVGCQCAEKLTDDYENPKRSEKELKNRTTRRTNFINRWLNPLLIGQFENDIANIAKKPQIFAKQGTTFGDVLNRLLGGESALTISS